MEGGQTVGKWGVRDNQRICRRKGPRIAGCGSLEMAGLHSPATVLGTLLELAFRWKIKGDRGIPLAVVSTLHCVSSSGRAVQSISLVLSDSFPRPPPGLPRQ